MARTSEDTSDKTPHGRSRLSRLSQIAGIMARHGFAPNMKNIPLVRAFVDERALPSAQPAGVRFAAMLEDLGPTFVKLGQIMSTRSDLLPSDFIESLARLQDQVPPFPFAEVRREVESALGRSIEDAFDYFDEVALASASVAQVHAARTKQGADVVVKVRRPGIDEQIRADSEILVIIAQLLELVTEEARRYHATEFVAEFQEALAAELDFSIEGRNLRAFAERNRGREGIHVPVMYPELSSRTVLTMERIRGRRISDLKGTPEAPPKIERLVELTFDHTFIDGVFHADPHPGNLLINDAGELCFIDFGLVGRVTREVQDRMLLLLLALSLRDADTLARLIIRLGVSEKRIELAPFRGQLARLLDRYFGLTVGEVNTGQVFNDLIDLSTRYGVRIPRELAILSRAIVSIEGVVRTLHPGFDPSKVISKRAEELVLERIDPRQMKGGGLRTALQLGLLIQEVPLQLGQTLMDLERGQVQVVIKSPDLEGLQNSLRGLGMQIFGGVLAGALVLGGLDVLARAGYDLVRAPALAAGAFIFAGGCFGVAFAWYLTGGRLPKIALKRLLSRRRSEKR
ncbi:MAG: AarF/ABC1/UbiB kinase family protein [Deltaproteobacteria bacterium]|nr:AarF/ABC1/UbiB kinase family protein [Deltaproteobacteria bacterium]